MSSSSIDHHHHHHHHHRRITSKRKLEDYDHDHDHASSRKNTSNNSKGKSVVLDVKDVDDDHDQESSMMMTSRGESSSGTWNGCDCERLQVQFFVRMISGGKTLVLQANLGDTVEMVHRKIHGLTGIPVGEQGLIYRGKQLQLEKTLEECGVRNDAGLQLVGRMRSTDHPVAWRVINDMVNVICCICRNDKKVISHAGVKGKIEQYMALFLGRQNGGSLGSFRSSFFRSVGSNNKKVSDEDDDEDEDGGGGKGSVDDVSRIDHCRIFMDACAPQALVMLYMSRWKGSRDCADDCIRTFVSFLKDIQVSYGEKEYCICIVLEFCRLLRSAAAPAGMDDNLLYLHCRSMVGLMLGSISVSSGPAVMCDGTGCAMKCVAIQDVFPFLMEVSRRLVKDLMLSVESDAGLGPSPRDVYDFSAFLRAVFGILAAAISKGEGRVSPLREEIDGLFYHFNELLFWTDKCLSKMVQCLAVKRKKDVEVHRSGWSQYFTILKELSSICVLYPGSKDRFWGMMRQHKVAVCALVMRYAKRTEDHSWLLMHKDILDFESRRHLAMFMFPELREDYDELHEMIIDRSQLLVESYEYVSGASTSSLQAGLFMEFKNEEATGPGVLREWFCLVCQAIFDPQNALFVACPLDRRRFFPNPASKVNPLHLQYFRFSGRVIALALMHKIQVGVVLDRIFFLQLAGKKVSMEDIRDTDPYIYSSCKQILEMDSEFLDSDGLGLTFVTEVEELGSRKVVELCYGGKEIVVNSENREKYVDLIVQHHFVKAIAQQVFCFGQGFSDIFRDGVRQETFFKSLELEDFDWMLRGSGHEISVDDWKAHTEYHGYEKSDPQMVWFWQVLGQLNAEQKRTLLCFWTSLKYLPVEGFRGLASHLFIYKSLDPPDHLPSSHTCFYRICIPTYPSKAVMRDRLFLITQEHIGCSFGTW